MRSPTEIMRTISSFIPFWAELQGGENRKELEDGAEVLKATMLFYHPQMPEVGDSGEVILRRFWRSCWETVFMLLPVPWWFGQLIGFGFSLVVSLWACMPLNLEQGGVNHF